MRRRTPITEFAVIPAKVGMYLYQWVMGSGSSFPHCRSDGFEGNRVFFSILLGPALPRCPPLRQQGLAEQLIELDHEP